MKLFISSLSLLPVVLAQYNYGGNSASSSMSAASTSPTSTSSASSSIQTIAVGQNGLKFSPNSLVVAPGRQVVFQFYPGGHSVTQSSFDAPCVPLNATSLFSGFINSSGGPAPQVFTVTINSTDPIWLYCAQIGHCQAGMNAVINPPTSGQTLDQYTSAAAKIGGSTAPSGVQGGIVGAASNPSPSASSSTSNSGTAASTSPTSGGKQSVHMVVGSLCLLFAIAVFAPSAI